VNRERLKLSLGEATSFERV